MVIGQYYADCVLLDVWINITVCVDNIVQKSIAAKSYSRTVSAHKLTLRELIENGLGQICQM